MKNSTILVISPHPDDLEIGMGGTAAKFADNGSRVISIVVTDGRGSSNPRNLSEDELAERRKKEVEKSSEILGIADLVLFNLRDVKSDINKLQLENLLNNSYEKYNPGHVYLPHYKIDKHVTHRTVSDIAIKSFFKIGDKGSGHTPFWFYEVWTPFPEYDRIEDIGDYVSAKKKAINVHKSQLEYKDYTNGILGLNRYRAVFNDVYENVNKGFAEVFLKYRPD